MIALNINLYISGYTLKFMDNLTEQVCIRITTEDAEQIRTQAEKLDRPVAWVAREAMRKGLKQM